MRSILKILTVSIFSGAIVSNSISSKSLSNDVPINHMAVKKFGVYNISFNYISGIFLTKAEFDSKKSPRVFKIYESDTWHNNVLPNKMWIKMKKYPFHGKLAYFYIHDYNIWEKIALIYGFNHNSSQDEIIKLMHENPIVDVTMTISFIKKGKWELLDFKANNLQKYTMKTIT